MTTIFLRVFICLTVLLHLLPTPYSCAGGKLNDFEQEAVLQNESRQNESRQDEKPDNRNDRHDEEHIDYDEDSASLWILPFLAIGYGGVSSWEQAKTRTNGEFIIPFARLDLSYQDIESDVTAGNLNLEAGYGPIAVWYQKTRFKENNPDSTLNLSYVHGLYRMTFGPAVEIDLGLGGIYLDGNQNSSGFGVSLPVKIHPWEVFGFEFRPVWSGINGNSVSDYTLTALGGWKHIKLQAGYRWLKTGGASLNGPFAGIALAF